MISSFESVAEAAYDLQPVTNGEQATAVGLAVRATERVARRMNDMREGKERVGRASSVTFYTHETWAQISSFEQVFGA